MTPERLLFDASPLLHSSRADRLDVLGSLVCDYVSVTTRAVVDEIGRNDAGAQAAVLGADWISVVDCDSLEALAAFGRWGARMGLTDDHNIGETTLCAYADCYGGTLIVTTGTPAGSPAPTVSPFGVRRA